MQIKRSLCSAIAAAFAAATATAFAALPTGYTQLTYIDTNAGTGTFAMGDVVVDPGAGFMLVVR